MIKIKYDPANGKIYAGNVLQSGKFGSLHNEVTEDCIMASLYHILATKTNGDNAQEIEVIPKILKYGKKPYKMTIKIEPIE